MDDARIEQLRREVLSQLGSSPAERATHEEVQHLSLVGELAVRVAGRVGVQERHRGMRIVCVQRGLRACEKCVLVGERVCRGRRVMRDGMA